MPGEYIVGREEQVFISEQSAWGTLQWPVAGDAIKHLKITITKTEERNPRRDNRQTRSRGATVQGKRGATWSLSGMIIPSGSLGVAPDAGLIFKHGLGVETVVGGTRVDYDLTKDLETVLNGISIHRFANHMSQSVRDAIVNDLTIKFTGSGEAEFEAVGEGSEEVFTGSSTLNGALTGGETNIAVQAGDGVKFSVDSVIDVGTSTAHRVTVITGDTLTVTPAISGAQSDGADVIPSQPSATTTGSPIAGIHGSLTIDLVSVPVVSGQIKISNKSKMRNNEFGTAVASGFSTPEFREVSFETEIYFTKTNAKYYGSARTLSQRDLNIFIGSAAGSQLSIDMNQVEIDLPAIDIPENEEAVIAINGMALPSTGEDEISMSFA